MQLRVVFILGLGLLAGLLMARPTWAQGQAIDGIIEGVVRTQAGDAAVAGATVRAFNASTGYERSVVSDPAGRYAMPLMPPGEYVVFVDASTFATPARPLRPGPVAGQRVAR